MPLEDFQRARPRAVYNGNDDGPITDYYEAFTFKPGAPEHYVVANYYFSKVEPYPLYEIRPVYEDSEYARSVHANYTHLGRVFPPANRRDPGQSPIVVIDTDDFAVGVWTYRSRLIISAALPNTAREAGTFGER